MLATTMNTFNDPSRSSVAVVRGAPRNLSSQMTSGVFVASNFELANNFGAFARNEPSHFYARALAHGENLQMHQHAQMLILWFVQLATSSNP